MVRILLRQCEFIAKFLCYQSIHSGTILNHLLPPSRATAIISQTLEALPVISVSLPIGLGLASKPDLVQNVVASSPLANVPLLVANLMDGSLWLN